MITQKRGSRVASSAGLNGSWLSQSQLEGSCRWTGILGDGRYTAKPLRAILAPDLDGLSLWPGIGGGRTRPATDCVILVQFADGDIGFPVVVGFQPGIAGTPGLPTVTELDGVRVNLGNGATGERVARLTDGVGVGTLAFVNNNPPNPGAFRLEYVDANGTPFIWLIAATGLTVTPQGIPAGQVELRGKIDLVGQTKVYA